MVKIENMLPRVQMEIKIRSIEGTGNVTNPEHLIFGQVGEDHVPNLIRKTHHYKEKYMNGEKNHYSCGCTYYYCLFIKYLQIYKLKIISYK
jgi:hypothetical protein